MKLAWYSNAPWGPTGYGVATADTVPRLHAAGHDVTIMANWGQQIGMGEWNGIPVYPQGNAQYSIDVIDEQARVIDPDWIITLYDVWVLTGHPIWKDRRVISWTPIDHYPVPPKVLEWAKQHRTIAMSRYGQDALKDAGVQADYIPHGIPSVFHPTPSDIRSRMRVPDDAFLVMINAANIGNVPPRKAWQENIQAMADLARTHKDVWLYIHTDLRRQGGVPVDGILTLFGFPMERLRVCDQQAYRWGSIDQEELARLYTTADVLLAPSYGEGFGIPVAEAMRCGTPAIVNAFSAQPEIVGDTGYKTRYQLFYDQGQHSCFGQPLIVSIREKLEEAYEDWKSGRLKERGQAAIEHSAQYDSDRVFHEHWMPLLIEMQQDVGKRKVMPHPEGNRAERRKKR